MLAHEGEQQVAFCFNDARLIGLDGLFAFCVVVCDCFFNRFCIVRSCVVSRSLWLFLFNSYLYVFCFCIFSGHTVVVLYVPEVLFVFCCIAVLRLNF